MIRLAFGLRRLGVLLILFTQSVDVARAHDWIPTREEEAAIVAFVEAIRASSPDDESADLACAERHLREFSTTALAHVSEVARPRSDAERTRIAHATAALELLRAWNGDFPEARLVAARVARADAVSLSKALVSILRGIDSPAVYRVLQTLVDSAVPDVRALLGWTLGPLWHFRGRGVDEEGRWIVGTVRRLLNDDDPRVVATAAMRATEIPRLAVFRGISRILNDRRVVTPLATGFLNRAQGTVGQSAEAALLGYMRYELGDDPRSPTSRSSIDTKSLAAWYRDASDDRSVEPDVKRWALVGDRTALLEDGEVVGLREGSPRLEVRLSNVNLGLAENAAPRLGYGVAVLHSGSVVIDAGNIAGIPVGTSSTTTASAIGPSFDEVPGGGSIWRVFTLAIPGPSPRTRVRTIVWVNR